ncbi:MAG: ATP-grasp peptide maturase system methyltransferase [Streptosporangiaceae bacterium]
MTREAAALADDILARRLRRGLAATLTANRQMPSEWKPVFERVPRHPFVPRVFVSPANDGLYKPLDGTLPGNRKKWLRAAYTDDICVTQVDGNDDAWHRALEEGSVEGEPTCTSSQPSLMAAMLALLDLRDGHRVLEVGTGTGYNAALICERLGSAAVSSVDVDAGLVAQAQRALTRLGYSPILAAVDGAAGYPANAPYDRVVATCSFGRVPISWVEQARPGAVILVNLFRCLGGGILVRLVVSRGGIAQGRFVADTGGFMPSRAEAPVGTFRLYQRVSGQDGKSRETDLDPEVLRQPDVRFLAALMCDDMAELWSEPQEGPEEYWLLSTDGSWARHTGGAVSQGGPRRLWDQLERGYARWLALGKPTRHRFGLTVTSEGQELWIDEPSCPLRAL